MIALTAANAITPAMMSLGFESRTRMTRLRSASTSKLAAAAFPRRRRRGVSSSFSTSLGTSFHLLPGWHVDARYWRQLRDVAGALLVRRHEAQRQFDCDGRSPVELALHVHLAAVQRYEAFHDRQSQSSALMAALIGFTRLEERITNSLKIFGCDADAGVYNPQHQAPRFDGRRCAHTAAALGEFDRVRNQIQHDLLECAGIAGHFGQILW